jgi:hypothetical protein
MGLQKHMREMTAVRDAPIVVIMGATNRPEDIDAAVLRRFQFRIEVPLPNARAHADARAPPGLPSRVVRRALGRHGVLGRARGRALTSVPRAASSCSSAARAAMLCSRARNPRFYFVHASTKPRFLTKKEASKSGISCSAL